MSRPTESSRLRRLAAAWPLAALGLLAAVAAPHSSTPVDAQAYETGMRIQIDPITKTPTGVPAGSAFLAPGLNRSSAGLTQFRLPDGGYGVDLQGRFMSASMIRRNTDGSFESICTQDHDHALDFVRETKATRAPTNDPSTWEVR